MPTIDTIVVGVSPVTPSVDRLWITAINVTQGRSHYAFCASCYEPIGHDDPCYDRTLAIFVDPRNALALDPRRGVDTLCAFCARDRETLYTVA